MAVVNIRKIIRVAHDPNIKLKRKLPRFMSFFTRKTAYFLRERVSMCGCRASNIASLSDCEHHFTHVCQQTQRQSEQGKMQGMQVDRQFYVQLTWRTRAVTWDPAISRYFPSILFRASLTILDSYWFGQHKNMSIMHETSILMPKILTWIYPLCSHCDISSFPTALLAPVDIQIW